VTNLNDSGPGSFRDAVSAGNRIVVFDVGGYVVLQSPVSLSSNLTIAGQTAPGGGIGIMVGEVSLSNQTSIIMRNVRMWQGNQDPDTGKSALNMGTATNIILDHCSFAYGQWDSVDAVGTVNFTVQNSIIADPIGQQFGAHVEVGP
jgi:pectate lyase